MKKTNLTILLTFFAVFCIKAQRKIGYVNTLTSTKTLSIYFEVRKSILNKIYRKDGQDLGQFTLRFTHLYSHQKLHYINLVEHPLLKGSKLLSCSIIDSVRTIIKSIAKLTDIPDKKGGLSA